MGLCLNDIVTLDSYPLLSRSLLIKKLDRNKKEKESKIISYILNLVEGFYYAGAALMYGSKNYKLYARWHRNGVRKINTLLGVKKKTIWGNLNKSRRL